MIYWYIPFRFNKLRRITLKKISKPESRGREDGTSGTLESNSNFIDTQTQLAGWNVLQTDDTDTRSGTDITLFTQGSLSILV